MGFREGSDKSKDNNGADQRRPKQFDLTKSTSKWLEHLASAKVGEELLDRGFEKHLGYGITDVAIKGIEEGNLCVYKKDGIYYITTSDKAQKYIGDGYKLQTIHGEVNQDMDLIEELERSLDKIMWDLPNIHAIRTVKKEHWYKNEDGKPIEYWKDKDGKPIEYWKDGHGDFPSGQRPEVLITDQEDIVQERMVNPRTESGKEGWKTVLPWASPEFGISGETKDKNIYKENKDLLENIDEKSEYNEEIIKREKDFIKLYYNSDSYIRKEVKSRYIDGINLLKNILTDERIRNAFTNPGLPGIIRDNIEDFLDKISREIQDLGQRLQPIVHGAIKTGLSNLGLEELQQSKIFIKGDLYLHQGNSLTDKPSETSVPVDVEQLKKIEKESGKVKCDLKVYVIQRPDNTNTENNSDNKDPKILVTDDRSLVARRIKQGWKALPGTQIGIELGNEELKQIYDAYNKLSKETKGVREKIDLCDEVFGKFYWNIPEEQRQHYEEAYQKSMNTLKIDHNSINNVFNTFKDFLVEWIKGNNNLSKLLKNDLLGKLGSSEEESTSSSSHEKLPQRPVRDVIPTTGTKEKVNGSATSEEGPTNGEKSISGRKVDTESVKGAENGDKPDKEGEDNKNNNSEVYKQEIQNKIKEKVQQLRDKIKSVKVDDDNTSTTSLETPKISISEQEEIAVTLAYCDLLSKVEEQLSNTDHNPQTLQKMATKIDDINPGIINSNEYNNLSEVNHKLRSVSEYLAKNMLSNTTDNTKEDIKDDDLNPFQLALRDAIETTMDCDAFANRWRKYYEPWFDFNEPWLVESMRNQGIEPNNINEDIRKSHGQFLENKDVKYIMKEVKEIWQGDKESPADEDGMIRVNPKSKVAYEIPPEKIIETYESLIRASANLKDISDKLKHDITVREKPKCINGREVLPTPGDDCDCMINSLLAVSNPGLLKPNKDKPSLEDRWSATQTKAKEIRKYLVEKKQEEIKKMSVEDIKKKISGISDNYKIMSDKDLKKSPRANLDKQLVFYEQRRFLNVHDDLPKVIEFMAKKNGINPSGSLVVYRWTEGRMWPCITVQWDEANNVLFDNSFIKDPTKPHYAILLEPGHHFEAMITPEELGMNKEQIKEIFWKKERFVTLKNKKS